jgi:cytochrome c-type biogenesis protein CcsB
MGFVTDWFARGGSGAWVGVTDVACLAGVAAALLAVGAHARAALGRSPGALSRLLFRAPVACLVVAAAAMATAVAVRWGEVNHFPSQTMSEVLGMFTLALLAQMVVLHLVLGLARRGPGWAVLDDVLVALVLGGVAFTHAYVRTLSTAQRDLPPALQSYWFPPHLSSLMISYATMIIAALICLAYFVTRFWSGVFGGGQPLRSQLLILAGLALVPFVHVVTLPVLALSGLVFFALLRAGRLPRGPTLARLEKDLDDVSFRAFAVGIPFLTAGLWMGSFWAQEAWANYWGWDSKENSALITWLVYIVYIHCRMLGGYRGAKAMSVLMGGALSVFVTFPLFGYMPDSQKSLHRYTDDGVQPQEGRQGPSPVSGDQARLPEGVEIAPSGGAPAEENR